MKKVVIIGGGFAGACLVRKLHDKFKVILIDTKDYFEFTPSILRTIVEPEHMKRVQVPHFSYLGAGKLVKGIVTNVDREKVYLGKKKIDYDYLVICSGSTYQAPIKEQGLIIATRASQLRSYHSKLDKSDKITIVGGGLVGVELAAEIAEHYSNKNITLVQSAGNLIPRNTEQAQEYAYNFLIRKGVKILFNERLVDKKGKNCIMQSGLKIKSDLAFLCTGITPNTKFLKEHFGYVMDEKGYIKVLPELHIPGVRNVFAAGDLIAINEEKTAQNAEKHAKIVAENIIRLEEKEHLVNYSAKSSPLVISLGRYNGIFEYGKIVFTGWIPGLLKRIVEWKEMRKLR